MSLRLFVAIPVPAPIKAALSVAQGELKSAMPAARISWTRPESMHLTLRFLGAVALAKVEPLIECLGRATRDFGALPLICERLGCFPTPQSPRVLWGWVHDPVDRLAELSQRISQAVSVFTEEPPEARFTGHITLGRVRQKLRGTEARQAGEFVTRAANRVFGSWTATTVELRQSELAAGGSRYSVMKEFDLTERSTIDPRP